MLAGNFRQVRPAVIVRQGKSAGRGAARVESKESDKEQPRSCRTGQRLYDASASSICILPLGIAGGGTWIRRGMHDGRSRKISWSSQGMNSGSIHSTSVVDASAKIGSFTTILEGVTIGEGCSIGSGCVIGPDVNIAKDCVVGSNCTLSNATIGERVVLLPGVRIGQDGFGFLPTGNAERPIMKKPQTLRVVIGDDVEIGANSTIDRGSWRDTVIGAHSKLDNMVQVAHNVVMGRACLVASQSGIAGSTTVGDRVMIGGQVGIAQHLKIGDGAMIAGKSGVMTDLEGGGSYGGCPAVPARQWHKQTLVLRRLAQPKGGASE